MDDVFGILPSWMFTAIVAVIVVSGSPEPY